MGEPHSLEQKKADVAAVQAGHCPECGEDLTNVLLSAHAQTHWPDYGPTAPIGADAARRKKLVLQFVPQPKPEKEVE
jgi:hypothetical protein